MAKVYLDKTFVTTARCKEGKPRTDYFDTEIRGFMLECRRSGGKTYHFRYHTAVKELKYVKIGRFEDISVANARKMAQRLRSEVVMGGSPAEDKEKAKAVPRYSELAEMHLADAKLHQRSFSTTEMYVRRHLVPKWGKVRLTEINSRAVAQWLAAKREEGLAPATVVKLKAIFGRSFELGARWDVPGCERNPTRGIKLPPLNNARQLYLDGDQAARLLKAAENTRNPQLPAILGLLLLTGMRVTELLSSRWQHVDIDRRTLFVPTSKTGRSRHVPLSLPALDVIAAIPRREGATYMFPNPRDLTRHLTTVKHAFESARAAAGLEALHLHDLRHSAASAMVAAGIDLYAVGKVLGHANVASSARYSHLANDTLLAAVDAGAAKLGVGQAA